MIIENITKVKANFTDTEKSCIQETIKILDNLIQEIESRNLDTLECNYEWTYDISDIYSTIETLRNFMDLNEIFA